MKSLLVVMSLMVSVACYGNGEQLRFSDFTEVQALVVKRGLPVNYIRLHRPFSGERMIAGDFSVQEKNKTQAKSFIHGLRSRLSGGKGFARF